MSSGNGGSVVVTVEGRDLSLAKLLQSLEAKMKSTDAAGERLGASLGTSLTAGQARAAATAGRLAVAEGQVGVLSQRAATELARTGTASAQLAAAQTRAELATLRLSRAQTTAAGSTGTFAQQLGGSLKSSLLGIVGPMALVGTATATATKVVGSFVEAFKFKAELDNATAAINAQLKGVRDLSVVWSEATTFANKYKLTQAETTSILSSSIDVLRTSKASVSDLEAALLRLQSRDPSKPISEAARALRELNSGDVTSIKELFNISAGDALKMKNEIVGGADAVKVLTGFLDGAGNGMDALARRTEGATGKMLALTKANEDYQIAQAKFAQGPGLAILTGETELLSGATAAMSGEFGKLTEGLKAYFGVILAGGTDEQAMAAREAVLSGAIVSVGSASVVTGAQLLDLADRHQVVSFAALQLADVQAHLASEHQAGGEASGIAARALENLNESSLRAAIKAQELLDVQTGLARIGASVAAGHMSAADGARILQVQYGYTSAEAERLIGLQVRLAQLQNTAIVGAHTPTGDVGVGAFLAGQEQVAADKVKGIFANLTGGARQYENARTGIARAGGGTRLSDQAKLDNSLLSQQETFANQAEQAEQAHGKKLLDIQKEFDRKSKEQQNANEVSKLGSRESFYDALTQASKDLGPKESQALSASYEQAYAQSQAIAQAGQQKLAADYLAFKQKEIQAELEFQKARAAAQKSGDKGEVGRLDAIHKLHQNTAAEEEKQLLAGGDTNVKAKDDAVTTENQAFVDLQNKNALAAEQKADRTVTAAQREGKAVQDVNALLTTQEGLLNRIAAPVAGAVPAAGAAPGAAGVPPTPGAVAPVDLAGVLAALRDAVAAVERAVVNDTKETTGAIRSLGPRLSGA